ncbi:hypothetical protein Gyru_ORF98 [Gynaephora ruoergensis nucleopolyhedrovirus]|nr:hypothetical protein Gyru_ORF98 [Gynaephora ruoergensis nucleopolyhedrovirus]
MDRILKKDNELNFDVFENVTFNDDDNENIEHEFRDETVVNFDQIYVCETITGIVLSEQKSFCLCADCFKSLTSCRENIFSLFRPIKQHNLKILRDCSLCTVACRECKKSLVIHSKPSDCESCSSYCRNVYDWRATCHEENLQIDYHLYGHGKSLNCVYEREHGCQEK